MEEYHSQEEIIRQLEERLLSSDVRHSSEEIAILLADDFIEFGSSGRVLTKEQIMAALQDEPSVSISMTDFHLRSLSPDVALVTYRAIKDGSSEEESVISLRSSLWQKVAGRWQMVFHQGTLLREE